jgi:hypothetical protein
MTLIEFFTEAPNRRFYMEMLECIIDAWGDIPSVKIMASGSDLVYTPTQTFRNKVLVESDFWSAEEVAHLVAVRYPELGMNYRVMDNAHVIPI